MKKHASSYQKKLFGATLATMVAAGTLTTAVPVHTHAEEVGIPSFSDVKNIESHHFYDSVRSLASRGIVKGFGDGTFKPYQSVTRGQMASVLAKTLGMNIENVKNPGFKDVKVTDEYYGPIAALVNAGIIDGYSDKTFKPGEPLTRAQMSKIISNGFKLEEEKLTNTPFTDVKVGDWYADYVQALIANKITTGTTPTTFAPNAHVTRGQMASFIVRSESPVQRTAKLIGVTNESVTLSTGTYALSADLKKVLNASNSAALLGAVLEYTVKDGVIDGISSIELTANGDETNNVVLDGQGSKFAGTIRVNGDYVSLKNLTIVNDLEIGKEVENSFKAFEIKVLEGVILNDKTSISRDNNVLSTAAVEKKEPTIAFTDSTIQSVEVSKSNRVIIDLKGNSTAQGFTLLSNVHLKADKGITLPKVNIKKGATNVTLDASVDNLSVDTPNALSIDGTATIKNVTVESKSDLKLQTTGKIGKMIVKLKGTAITLGTGTKVDSFELPEGVTAKDIIVNFDELNSGGTNNGGNNSGNNGGNNGDNNGGGGNNGGDTDKNFQLTLMHTNDTHAKVETAPKRITAIKNERAENPDAVLVDAGDVFSGTLYFNQYRGLADLAFMNLAKYDVMTFGNHEFDLGSEGNHEALATFIKGANFPFVSANADFSKDESLQGLFSDLVSSDPENGKIYNGIVKEVDGEKVGFFGLTTEETKGLSSPGQVTFTDYIIEAEKAVKAFEDMGVNKIVAVSHIGYDDNPEVDNDLTLAAQVDGIDIIIGGHSHTKLAGPVVIDKDETGETKDKTIIVQASSQGDFLGTLDVEFDTDGKVITQTGELIEVSKLSEDPEAKILLEPYKTEVDKVAKEEIGVSAEVALENPRTDGDNSKPSVRKNETILGNLITDGMLAKAKSLNPEVIMAFQNGGGIRASIDAGPITVGEVITVLPFGNTLSTMEITGAELKEAFETSVGVYPLENGGFLHVAGAKVEFDSSKAKGERVVSISYENADGTYTEIQDTEIYTVATNYFTAQGGDNYDVFKKIYEAGKATDLGLSDWENLREHLVSLGDKIPTEIEGRIVDVKASTEPEIVEDPGTTPTPVATTKPPLYNSNPEKLLVSQIARYDSGQGETGTEILAYDASTNKGFVTNGAVGGFDILSFGDVESGEFKQLDSTKRVVIEEYGIPGVKNITSIASHPTADLIAIAAYGEKTDRGYIVFADKDGKYVKHVQVGFLPDMVTFTPDGTKAIVANEGEPENENVENDPAGSISVISIVEDMPASAHIELTFTEEMLDEKVRMSFQGKGKSYLAQLEPEYVTVSPDSKTAYVTLQENNAVATVDLVNNEIQSVKGLGVIDHSEIGNEMDAFNDKEGVDKIGITKAPILTFHMPDAIDTFTVADKTYIITPNEGDSRDYADWGQYTEVAEIKSKSGALRQENEKEEVVYDKPIKLNADYYGGYTQDELDLFDFSKFKGYKATIEDGLNADGTAYEAIYGYGGRSFSIFDATDMRQVYDSGSDFEKIIAEKTPEYFNTNSDEMKVDNRSDDKGPEPETAVVGEIDGTTYGFIALERYSGIIVYDLTNVDAPEFVTLISSRDFTAGAEGDVSPEGLQFIPADESLNRKAMLAATHEVSGTIAVYEFGAGRAVPAEEFSGTETEPKVYEGNVIVSVTEADKLENAVIKGDLILTGSPKDTFLLTNIEVEGNADFSGLDGDDFNFNGLTVAGEIIL